LTLDKDGFSLGFFFFFSFLRTFLRRPKSESLPPMPLQGSSVSNHCTPCLPADSGFVLPFSRPGYRLSPPLLFVVPHGNFGNIEFYIVSPAGDKGISSRIPPLLFFFNTDSATSGGPMSQLISPGRSYPVTRFTPFRRSHSQSMQPFLAANVYFYEKLSPVQAWSPRFLLYFFFPLFLPFKFAIAVFPSFSRPSFPNDMFNPEKPPDLSAKLGFRDKRGILPPSPKFLLFSSPRYPNLKIQGTFVSRILPRSTP